MGPSKPLSYAESVLNNNSKKVNFRNLASVQKQDGCDVVLPRDSVRAVQEKLANTLYGYFLGDRVAYPVVEYFVRNNWKKFGLQKTMMNANGFFFFKFADQSGMMSALKAGPWIIRSQPLFLNIWSASTKLEKKEVKTLQLWVKIHDVPITAYMEDGLSLIATAIGEPKMLDSYTTNMCMDAWGRSSYARALIEISAENDFKEELVIAVPELDGDGFVKEKLYVEYEWSPHRCGHCRVFDHSDEGCPKQVRANMKHGNMGSNSNKNQEVAKYRGKGKNLVDDDGFTTVEDKKAAKRSGFPVNKQKPKFEYRPIGKKPEGGTKKGEKPITPLSSNPFDVLRDDIGESSKSGRDMEDGDDNSDDEEVMEVYNEMNEFLKVDPQVIRKGASTPSSKVIK
ncbi:uncharacterized protein LOC110866638 [Helianthus annuus]|uniref:uncharacterized protein LOC110866638 n=1 Tax=Helianthus annuus TaxID=4232 RepID=UPI000B8F26CC|nr:uncharacterized protein LOC110866638 [Helianthus annuus]